MNKPLLKKLTKILSNVLLYGFIALCATLVVASFVMKKSSNDALTFFGYQARIIQSNSMEKSEFTDVSDYKIKDIPVKALVFIQTVPEDEAEAEEWFSSLKIGDVITFRYVYNGQVTITHRIVNIEEKATGGRILTLEGDNKNASTNLSQQTIDTSEHFSLTNYNYVIGKVTGKSYALGLLLYAMNTPVGLFCIVVIPCLIIIVMEIIRIVNVLGEEKNKKTAEETEKKEAEIELLKQQLAALQVAVEKTKTETADNALETENPSSDNTLKEEEVHER